MINTSVSLDQVNAMSKDTLLEQLDIKITEIKSDYLVGTMPVDRRTHQPMGLLHGGASAALIETLGSVGSSLIVDPKTQAVVGLEINVNHLRGVQSGMVTGKAAIVHAGKRTHVWNINLTNDKNQLIATGRLTVMVIEKR